jgi:hypothetical protein
MEAQYCLLFQEVLGKGPLSPAERARLDRTADNLGLDPERVLRLEAALRADTAPDSSRNPRDTLVDLEDPSSFSRSSGHISISVAVSVEEARPRAISVTFEPVHKTEEVQTARVSRDLARVHVEHEQLHARYDACERAGRVDAQWCTAAVLVRRGVATADEVRLYEALRGQAPPRPRTALSLDAWTFLFHPDEDRLTSEIFEMIAPAALLCRVAAMRSDGSFVPLDDKQRQDPTASTVSVVRALAWSAATLGLATPPIYVAPQVDAGLEVITHFPPASRAGARMLSGQSAVHLAFHAARHITWFRGDHFVCTLVPTLSDLCDLFVAALSIGGPEIVLHEEARARARLIADAIGPLLEPAALARLRELANRFVGTDARIDLQTWAHAVGDTAGRAGLLLCGDLDVACQIVAQEQRGEDRVRDLERFFASDAATELRSRMGISLSRGGPT